MKKVPTTLALLASASLLLSGCTSETTEVTSRSTAIESVGDYAVTIDNCGINETFDAPPERLLLLHAAAVPALASLNVLDRVVARAGAFEPEYFDEDTMQQIEEIPELSKDLDPSGHLQLSREVVLAQQPDLVLGEASNINRSSLPSPTIQEPALCPGGLTAPTYEDVYTQLEIYGQVFHRENEAGAAIADLKTRVDAVVEKVEEASTGGSEPLTAAILYPTVGGGTTYAYGANSMATPQIEAAGFTNVFAGVNERVFEVNTEELLARDPDVIVLLYSAGEPGPVEDALKNIPGADRLSAIRSGNVMTQLFNFTEPATPLTVDGLENIVDWFYK